jgi:hypothetical protein
MGGIILSIQGSCKGKETSCLLGFSFWNFPLDVLFLSYLNSPYERGRERMHISLSYLVKKCFSTCLFSAFPQKPSWEEGGVVTGWHASVCVRNKIEREED